MTTAEKVHSVLAIVLSLYFFVGAAQFVWFVAPEDEHPEVWHFVAFLFALVGAVVLVTAILNLVCGRLAFVSTVVQIVFTLPVLPLGTALGIWSIVLLRRKSRRESGESDDAATQGAAAG